MTASDYKNQISLNVANSTINQLITELAQRCADNDELKTQVADLEAKLNPKPEAPAEAQQ